MSYENDNLYLKLDLDGEPYVIGVLSPSEENSNNILVIDSNQNVVLPISTANTWRAYVLKLNSTLNVVQLITLNDSVICLDKPIANTLFQDIFFD